MIDLKKVSETIFRLLESCGFDDITDGCGYYVIKEFEDGSDRVVDVYKSTSGGNSHYVVYCSFEDDTFDYYYTEDLTCESLEKCLQELSK